MTPIEIEEIDGRHLSCKEALVQQCMTKTYDFKRILITKEKKIKTCFDLCTRQIEKPDNSLHYISKTREEVDKANAFKVFNSPLNNLRFSSYNAYNNYNNGHNSHESKYYHGLPASYVY